MDLFADNDIGSISICLYFKQLEKVFVRKVVMNIILLNVIKDY